MKQLSKILMLILLIISIQTSFAQISSSISASTASVKRGLSDVCNCDVALEHGTDEEFLSRYNSHFLQTMAVIFNHEYSFWESDAGKHSSNTEISIAYAAYSGLFSGSETDDNKKEKFSALKDFYQKNLLDELSIYKYYSQKTKASKPYDAWLACKKSCNEDGILLDKKVSGNTFTVTLTWLHRNTTDKEKITSIVPNNAASLNIGTLKENATISGKSSYTGKFRIINLLEDASVSVDVSEYGSSEILVPGTPIVKPELNIGVPVGTIIAYGGTIAPKGKWLLCNGDAVTQSKYPELYEAIGTSWGKPNTEAGSFNLPDLRGMFLRGMLGTAASVNDPAMDDRTERMPGGAVKNAVGSYQTDIVGKHKHTTSIPTTNGNKEAGNEILNNQGGCCTRGSLVEYSFFASLFF